MHLEWQKDFEIGYEEFDEQHKWLINLYNRIVAALDKNSGASVVGKYMASLKHYTVFHFGAEESALQKFEYPDLDYHKEQHQEFITSIGNYLQKHLDGNTRAAYDLLDYLKNWLLNHIMYEDRVYVSHIYSRQPNT